MQCMVLTAAFPCVVCTGDAGIADDLINLIDRPCDDADQVVRQPHFQQVLLHVDTLKRRQVSGTANGCVQSGSGGLTEVGLQLQKQTGGKDDGQEEIAFTAADPGNCFFSSNATKKLKMIITGTLNQIPNAAGQILGIFGISGEGGFKVLQSQGIPAYNRLDS